MKLPELKDTVLPLLAFLSLPVAQWAGPVFWSWLHTNMPDKILARVFLLLLLLLCVSISYAISLRWKLHKIHESQKPPHRFQDDCTVDETTGMYRHKKKSGFFCLPCAA